MKTAARIGMPLFDFYRMTFVEFTIYVNGYYERKKTETEEYMIKKKQFEEFMISHAWLSAKLQRAKRIPDLEKLINNKKQPKKNMTPEEILEQVKLLNVALGGEVIG